MKLYNIFWGLILAAFISNITSIAFASNIEWLGNDTVNPSDLSIKENYSGNILPTDEDFLTIPENASNFPTSGNSFANTVFNSGKILGGTYYGKIKNIGSSITLGEINNIQTIFFNENSINKASINGTAEFNGNAINDVTGIIKSDSKFNNTSMNFGLIEMNAEFNDESSNMTTGIIQGNAKFNTSSINKGKIFGNSEFNANSVNDTSGFVSGNSSFNDSTSNLGTVDGNAIFNWESSNLGTVNNNSTTTATSTDNSLKIISFNISNVKKSSVDVSAKIDGEVTNSSFKYGLLNGDLKKVEETSIVQGQMSKMIVGLKCNTQYEIVAFAENEKGNVEQKMEFKTLRCSSKSRTGGSQTINETNRVSSTTISTSTLDISEENENNEIAGAATSSDIIIPEIFIFEKNLGYGAEHDDILTLQKTLNAYGYNIADSGNGSIDNETNYFGPRTHKALKKFQKDYNIPTTGYFGPMTRDIINKINLKSLSIND